MFQRFSMAIAMPLAMMAAACNPVANANDAERRITEFHGAYNDGDPMRLYGLTGQAFKDVTTMEEMRDLYTVVDARLGKVESSERVNLNVANRNGVNSTVVIMETQFEQGSGTETFTFNGGGDDFELVGWSVNSPRMAVTVDDLRPRDIEPEGEPAPEVDGDEAPSAVIRPSR